jgi:hypothetical protein
LAFFRPAFQEWTHQDDPPSLDALVDDAYAAARVCDDLPGRAFVDVVIDPWLVPQFALGTAVAELFAS